MARRASGDPPPHSRLLVQPSLHIPRRVPLGFVPPIKVRDAQHPELAWTHLEPRGDFLRGQNPVELVGGYQFCFASCHNILVRRSRR